MPLSAPVQLSLRILLVGAAYYAGAWFGVTQTITPQGIAILWPPNAILLTAFLLFPYRQWPWIALVALLAEILADIPSFPLWTALAFGLVNLFETLLAAWLIRRLCHGEFDFNLLRNGVYFLLFAPLLASSLAALFGASIYLTLGQADSSYWALWRLWWFGDALGLLLLTPLLVSLWHWLARGLPRPSWLALLEFLILALLIVLLGELSFSGEPQTELEFRLMPIILIPFGIWAAIRLGVSGASLVVALIAMLAISHLMQGLHPYSAQTAQYAVWLTQEYLAILAVVSIGLAILLREIREQRAELLRQEQELLVQNEHLEQRVTERTRALEEANSLLATIAATDPLTQIPNRRYFWEMATRLMQRHRPDDSQLSLLMFDLDHFKQVNDQLGHQAGDAVLRAIVAPIKTAIRPQDLFGRIGGEEFLILLPDSNQQQAIEVAERLCAQLARLVIPYEDQQIRITASFGVASWDGSGDLDQLVGHADQALYRAKAEGRNCVRGA